MIDNGESVLVPNVILGSKMVWVRVEMERMKCCRGGVYKCTGKLDYNLLQIR